MKYFIAFLSLIVVVLAYHDHSEHHADYVVKSKEDLAHARDHCVSKLTIADDLVEKYKKWEYPDDEKTHCYLKCIFEELGLYDDEKGFDVHKVHHQVAGDKVDHFDDLHKTIESCAKEGADSDDSCIRAYRGGICLINNNLTLVKQSFVSD
ncbi:PREDICTED: general odorant-binding protein 99b [Rhagoletis zephyria]|uniref:general odorant-binding protein 99b n=1 Tax=Rhagoletis zephyria TaxID=28612 RepID=UPI000811215C|nr:PREDICTED: general odorant-binding protein 99b [Rhagoletis zephyria]